MSTDDVPDPLAGIDLRAWQPPPPPAGQVDSILSQITEFTRVDGAPAIEIGRDREPRSARGQRARWAVIGGVIGAAAAVLVMLAVWPKVDEVATKKEPAPEPIAVKNPPVASPGGTVTPSLADCRALRDSEDWAKTVTCADERVKAGDQDAVDLAEQGRREAANKLAFDDLQAAIDKKDVKAATAAAKRVPADSVYYERVNQMMTSFLSSQAPQPEKADKHHRVKTTDTCDPKAYIEEAREAGRASLWSAMLKKALAANTCKSTKDARKLVLFAACKLGNKAVATKWASEFSAESTMRQNCLGVVDWDESEPAGTQSDFSGNACDANALLKQAREAGAANQWSKMLGKAEAANKCSPSKGARQLALMAACHLGNRDKAARYWKEFENSSQMAQTCIGITD